MEKKRKDAEYKKRLDELLAKIHADEEARKEKERKELEAQQERKRRKKADTKSKEREQNDGMYNIANDEVNKVQNPASDNLTEVPAELQADSHEEPQIESQQEPQATPQLPDSFSAFKSLPVSTQSQLLCTELCDTIQVFEQLQQYAKDTGYHGSFDELNEMASAISEENSRSYEDRKAQMIADELIRAGTTAQNFYQIKTESLAEAFISAGDIGSSLIPLIIKVEQKIGVAPDYEKNLALVNAIRADVKKYGEEQVNRTR
jgi:hypothetical protein